LVIFCFIVNTVQQTSVRRTTTADNHLFSHAFIIIIIILIFLRQQVDSPQH